MRRHSRNSRQSIAGRELKRLKKVAGIRCPGNKRLTMLSPDHAPMALNCFSRNEPYHLERDREPSSPWRRPSQQEGLEMNIANLLARKGVRVVTLGPEASIRQALALLAEHNIGAVVIVDTAGRPVGILSERDIVRAAARDEAVFAVSVASIMTRQVILGSPSDDLTSVGH